MKSLLVSARYAPHLYGGGEISVVSFAEGLVQAGQQVSVLTTHPGPAETTWLNGVKVIRARNREIYWQVPGKAQPAWKKLCWHLTDLFNPLMCRVVRTTIEEERPDLLQTHALEGFSCAAWYAAKSLGLPVTHYIHSYYLMCPRAIMTRGGCNCQKWCTSCRAFTTPRRRASRLVDGVIGNSHFVLDRHLQAGYFPNATSRTVIHGSYRGDQAVQAARAHGPLRIGYLGRLDPSKGVEWLLTRLKAVGPSGWELLIAGTGQESYERELKTAAVGMPVRFLGHEAPPALFSMIDLLVVPSLWDEPQGRVVFEAYAHGVPVAVSRQGGLPELVVEGETGFIFDIDDGAGFDRLMRDLIARPELLLGKVAGARAKALEFTPEASAAKMIEFSRKVVADVRERAARGLLNPAEPQPFR